MPTRTLTGETPIGAALAQVAVERIPAANGTPEARLAVELQQRADFELAPAAAADSPTHQLRFGIDHQPQFDHHDVTTGARRRRRSPASMPPITLAELATGKAVVTGRTFARVSYDIPASSSASRASARSATPRTAPPR